ncbi:MAG: DMT family transporter [Variibacter sp.]|nr:DMT family transporter [Variibacter sp.]
MSANAGAPETRESAPRGLGGALRRMLRALQHPYLLLALAALCWSGNHVVGRAAAGHVPPMGLSTLRWLLPAGILWAVARPHLAADWPRIKQRWGVMLLLGATGGGLFSAGQYLGLQYTTALNVSVLNSLTPVLIVAAGALVFRERVAPLQALGIATSLLGVVVVIAHGSLDTLRRLEVNRGDLLVVFSMAMWAVYSVYLRRKPAVHWASFTFVFALIASLGVLPLAVAEYVSGFHFQATWLTVFSVLYVSIFPSVIAFLAWMRGVETIGANRAGPFLHLAPIYSALLATTFLGERLHLFHVIGFGLILLGVWSAARRYA